MMKRLLSKGGWLLRVTTATVLLVVIGLSLAPRVVSHISTSAVVNAPVIVIRSPLEGVVEAYSLDTGSVVTRGQTLVSLREAGTDQTKQAELEARVHIADAAAKAVRNRIAEIEALRDSLVRRHALYAAWHRRILKSEVEEDEALLRGAVARAASLGREVDRATTLRTRGIVAESRIDEIRTRLTEQRERVSEITARLNTRRLKLAAIGEGVLAGTDGTNTPYTQQRLDEIDLELAALHDELVDHLAELAATRAQLAKERDIFLRDNQVALNAPTRGIVWRSASSSGQPVLPGDEIVELLDCGSRFLEAYLPESLMGSIAIGDMAEVRLEQAAPFKRRSCLSWGMARASIM